MSDLLRIPCFEGGGEIFLMERVTGVIFVSQILMPSLSQNCPSKLGRFLARSTLRTPLGFAPFYHKIKNRPYWALFILERVTGVEPVSLPWQGNIIATIRYPRIENVQAPGVARQ